MHGAVLESAGLGAATVLEGEGSDFTGLDVLGFGATAPDPGLDRTGLGATVELGADGAVVEGTTGFEVVVV